MYSDFFVNFNVPAEYTAEGESRKCRHAIAIGEVENADELLTEFDEGKRTKFTHIMPAMVTVKNGGMLSHICLECFRFAISAAGIDGDDDDRRWMIDGECGMTDEDREKRLVGILNTKEGRREVVDSFSKVISGISAREALEMGGLDYDSERKELEDEIRKHGGGK